MAGTSWTPFITAWQSNSGRFGRPDDIYFPGFDYSRFQVSYWQKFERALRFARDRDMIFSLVLDMNDSRVHPAPASDDEHRFIRYAIARFAAFSNITWDLGDDLDQYRDPAWTHATGTLIKQWDPYQHLATSHPVDNVHQDRTSPWFDFTSFQEWSRTQHAFMLAQRKQQQSLGRIIPQTNEEYGYEDHYPMWAKGLGSESADTLRRTAWEIVMAGGYQTAGETARRGTNVWPDSGGGWMNGRGDDTMTMFQGYAHMVDFFTSFEWWKTEPHDELVNNGNYCLAKPGDIVRHLPAAWRKSQRRASTGEIRRSLVGRSHRTKNQFAADRRSYRVVDFARGCWKQRFGVAANTSRSCEKIGKHAGLADGSVCPTLTHQDLRLSGAGAFACEPIFSQLRREPVPCAVYMVLMRIYRLMSGRLTKILVTTTATAKTLNTLDMLINDPH